MIAVASPDRATVETVLKTVAYLQRAHVIELEDVVVSRDVKGAVKLHQAVNPAAAGAATGALWSGLIALLFLAPLSGMAIGAAVGSAGGAMARTIGVSKIKVFLPSLRGQKDS